MAVSLPVGHGGDAQYFFQVEEATDGNNVIVAFTVMSQSVKADEERFPLHFQVFKVSNLFGSCSL